MMNFPLIYNDQLTSSSYVRKDHLGLNNVLSEMARLVRKYKGRPVIRSLAVRVTESVDKDVRTGLPDRRDKDAMAEAIYDWMNRSIAYVYDPNQIEYLQSPLTTLERKYGDCDDHTVLASTLLETLGIESKFKVVSLDRNNPEQYSHIYVIYKGNDGKWKPFDTTIHTQAGDEVPQIANSKLVGLSGPKANQFSEQNNYLKMAGYGLVVAIAALTLTKIKTV